MSLRSLRATLSGAKKEERTTLYVPTRTVSSTKLSRPRPYLCLYVCCDLALVSQLTVLLHRPLREALGCKCLPEALRSKFHARFFTATFGVRICVVRGVPVFDDVPRGGARLRRQAGRRRHRRIGRTGHTQPGAAYPARALGHGRDSHPFVSFYARNDRLGQRAVRSGVQVPPGAPLLNGVRPGHMGYTTYRLHG